MIHNVQVKTEHVIALVHRCTHIQLYTLLALRHFELSFDVPCGRLDRHLSLFYKIVQCLMSTDQVAEDIFMPAGDHVLEVEFFECTQILFSKGNIFKRVL